jgi:hypothetical protein
MNRVSTSERVPSNELVIAETPALADEAVEKLVEHDFIVLELH